MANPLLLLGAMPLPLAPGATVAVVGGGAIGLVNCKRLREAGLKPLGFEREKELGGLWIYRQGPSNKMYHSLHCNASFHSMAFDDFPHPREWGHYPSHWQIAEYLQAYAKHFGLEECYRTETEVERWEEAEGGRKWRLLCRPAGPHPPHSEEDQLEEVLVDGVVVCTGQTSVPRKINAENYPGFAEFRGSSIHSAQYRSNAEYLGKRVMVVGAGGASGADITIDTSLGAKQVVLSVRHPLNLIPRFTHGEGSFWLYKEQFWLYVPEWLQRFYGRCLGALDIKHSAYHQVHRRDAGPGDQALFAIPEKYRPPKHDVRSFLLKGNFLPSGFQLGTAPSPLGSEIDDVLARVALGAVRVRPEIKEFLEDGKTVVFEDGSEEQIDAIVWAIGYDRGIGEHSAGRPEHQGTPPPKLYYNVFPPRRPGLAYGLVTHPAGAHWPVADLIAQWIAQVFTGSFELPPLEIMEKEAIQDVEKQNDPQARGRFNPKVGWVTEHCIDRIAEAMARSRPTRAGVLNGLLFGGAERRRLLMRWLRSPRWRAWLRPEDMTDQLEEGTEPKFRSRL